LDNTTNSLFGEIMASDRLPSPKALAVRVMQLCDKDDVSNQEIIQAIKSDAALCSRLIKVANVRVQYQTRPIASITEAVSVLGLNIVRNLVLGLSLMEDTQSGTCPNFDYQRFWAHSLLTAITAQNLVTHKSAGSPEEIFILGLFCKVGVLGLATACPQEYGQLLRSPEIDMDGELVARERKKFNFDHNQLTEAMLADWGLPVVFRKIARAHEAPAYSAFQENSREWRLLHVLHVADYFSSLCLAPQPQRRKMASNLILIANKLGVELDALAKLADQSVIEWNDWSKFCNFRPIAVPRFEELVEAVPSVPAMHDEADTLPDGAGAFYKLRILVVDDDEIIRSLLCTLLEKAGHVVAAAENGQMGLLAVETFMPQAIITDWVMPEMNGVEFCKKLRQNNAWRNIYVFMLTSQDGVDRLVEAFSAGANDFMTKPINPKILFARLRAAQRVVQLQEDIEFERRNLHKFSDELVVINKRLRKSEVCARAILDNSPYMAWLKDAEGRYVQVNKNCIEYLRRNGATQIIGKTDAEVWPQKAAGKFAAIDENVIKSKEQIRVEETYLDQGNLRWFQIYVTPVIEDGGKVFGTTGFARDITERKRLEVDLQIAAIAFEAREGIFVTDANSVIQRVNNAFTEITGYSAADAVGKTPHLFASGRHDPAFYLAIRESLTKSGAWQGEIWNRRKNGEVYPEYLTITTIKNEHGEIAHYVSTLHDITERKSAEREIYDLAFYDALTHLPNRRLLNDRLNQALVACKRNRGYNALMFLDLDNFKPLNDTHGHSVGDLLLIEAACRISGCVREADTVARFGGDEFVVILGDLSSDAAAANAEARVIAEKIKTTLAAEYQLKLGETNREFTTVTHRCTTCIGVVMFNSANASKEELLRDADVAMYRAKDNGRDRIVFHASGS